MLFSMHLGPAGVLVLCALAAACARAKPKPPQTVPQFVFQVVLAVFSVARDGPSTGFVLGSARALLCLLGAGALARRPPPLPA